MEVICLQHLLIEYLEKYNFLKIANANSIFTDMKSIIQLFFFPDRKYFELERLEKTRMVKVAKSCHQVTWTQKKCDQKERTTVNF